MYVHSILHHWVCILISEGHFIEYVCCWEFVCELFGILFYLYLLCHISLRVRWVTFSSGLRVIVLSIITFIIDVTSLHVWFDLITIFLRIFIISLSSSSLLVIHPIRFTPLLFLYSDPFLVWHFLCIILTHLIISSIFFIASLLLS